MILYWSSKPWDTPAKIIQQASSVEVDPLGGARTEEVPYMNLYKQGNGMGLHRNIGWSERVTFTLSEDEYSRPVSVNNSTFYVFELVKLWRRAPFMWLQDDAVNGGVPLAVYFDTQYQDTAVASQTEFNETQYVVLGKVFHFN